VRGNSEKIIIKEPFNSWGRTWLLLGSTGCGCLTTGS